MKIRSTLILIFLFFASSSFSQQHFSVSLSKIQFSLFPGQPEFTGNQGFPEYFRSHSYLQKVVDSIAFYTRKYFYCDSLKLDENYETYLFFNQYPAHLKPYKPRKTQAGWYKMSLTTYLEYNPEQDSSVFQLRSVIYLTNDLGKFFTQRKNTIPFSVLANPTITNSDTLISQTDFEQLYFENLRLTIQGLFV